MSNGKSIEQLLREGVRPEDLKMQLDDEIAKAKRNIEYYEGIIKVLEERN